MEAQQTATLDPERSRALALALQSGVPLVPDPWGELGAAIGAPAYLVLDEIRAWERDGRLREISAVIEGQALGWDSALVAAAVPEARLEAVAEIVGACPTVTHDYERRHAWNLWFTVAMPPEIGVDAALAVLGVETGLGDAFHALRRTHTFKIGVRFDPETMENTTASSAVAPIVAGTLSPTERTLVRALQTPLPYVPAPYDALARRFDTTEGALLSFARGALGGLVRRYVGTFRHRKLGVGGNGMAVWDVPDERLAEVGARLAEAPEVSHCYARNPASGFPFRLYSMIHARDEAAVREITTRLAAEVGVERVEVLFSAREFKKQRLRYFTPELDQWWAARRAS